MPGIGIGIGCSLVWRRKRIVAASGEGLVTDDGDHIVTDGGDWIVRDG